MSSGGRNYINPQRMAALGLDHLTDPSAPAAARDEGAAPARRFDDNHGGGGPRGRDNRNSGRGPRHGGGGGHGRGSGGGGHGNRPEGARRRRDFGYDDTVRPRPPRTDTLWGLEPTAEVLQRHQEYFLKAASTTSYSSTAHVLSNQALNNTSSSEPVDFNSLFAPGSSDAALQQLLATQGLPASADAGAGSEWGSGDAQRNSSSRSFPPNCTPHRVYVGPLPPDTTVEDLTMAFRTLLPRIVERPASARSDPVSTVTHKGSFAFVEFYDVDDAEAAYALDGATYERYGKPPLMMRVRPTKDMSEFYEHNPPKQYSMPGVVSNQVPNGPNKIYLGNLPPNFGEAEIQKIAETVGPLQAFKLARSPDGARYFAFFIYKNPELTSVALNVLHGFDVGGKRLACSIAGQQPPPLPAPGMPMATGAAGGVSGAAVSGVTVSDILPPGILSGPVPANATEVPPLPAATSRVITLRNMVTPEELEAEYDEIMADVREKAETAGAVKAMKARGDAIFIEFVDVASADRAAKMMHGLTFSERIVIVDFIPEALWEADLF